MRTLYFLGLSYSALDEHQEACRAFSAAIERPTNYAAAYSRRGITYAELGRLPEPSPITEAISQNPADTTSYFNRGVALAELNDFEMASRRQ